MSALTNVISRGVAASRPAAAATPIGALYQSTDTGVVERNNGTTWDVWNLQGPVLLATRTAATSASLDFTSVIVAGYDEYIFEFVSILPATNNVSFVMLLSNNNGSAWLSTNYRYALQYCNDAAASGVTGSTVDTSLLIANNVVNTSLGAVQGTIHLHDPLSATNSKVLLGKVGWLHNDTNRYKFDGAWWNISATAVNAIQFKMSSGNITSGVIRCYGVAK